MTEPTDVSVPVTDAAKQIHRAIGQAVIGYNFADIHAALAASLATATSMCADSPEQARQIIRHVCDAALEQLPTKWSANANIRRLTHGTVGNA